MSFINLLSPGGTGGTFLLWSLEYLTQKSLQKSYIDEDFVIHHNVVIPNNPLRFNTSHSHKKSHPKTHNFDEYYDIFNKEGDINNDLITTYTVDSMLDEKYNYINFLKTHKHITNILYRFEESDVNIIFGLQFSRIPGIANFIESLATTKYEQREIGSIYYPKMIRNQLNIGNWNKLIQEQTANTHYIDFKKFFYDFENIVLDLIDALHLSVIHSRIHHWKTIYYKWQERINVPFYKDINYITKCIINNIPHDLSQYNISFIDEIILSSELLYKHNKCLRSHGLCQMPLDTTEWYLLLEDNIYHTI